ncbi:hypothetical protein [uncultured Aureimonas sp.]|uniref:hypothetical protein n=1 Tax=uncultured Aureimonas sp. TaxID=1604662 RepID=UPI0025E07467|nr:hypothetical protein [uncultured Aureimonas sp.]
MSSASRIFRQTALDRLSSPEQLDRLIGLTKPRDWLAALALAAVMGLGVAWSIVGTVPVRVTGSGILIATGGRVLDAVAGGEGTLERIAAPVGVLVRKGDVVALVTNPELAQALADAQSVLAEREARHASFIASMRLGEAARTASLAARRTALEARIADADGRGRDLETDVARQDILFGRGLVT